MSKITTYLKAEAKIWAPDYDFDFRKTSVREYMKQNNVTRKAYIKEIRDEVNNNKKLIREIEGKDANKEAQTRWREKNKNQQFIRGIVVNMEYKALDTQNKPYTFTKTETLDFNKTTTKKNLPNDVWDVVENFKLEKLFTYSSNTNITDAVVLGLNSENIKTFQKGNKLQNVRIKNAGACIIDGFNKQDWDTNTGKCVFDYIISTYGNIKGFKSYCNYEDLQDLFNNGSNADLLKVGVNTKEIKNFC